MSEIRITGDTEHCRMFTTNTFGVKNYLYMLSDGVFMVLGNNGITMTEDSEWREREYAPCSLHDFVDALERSIASMVLTRKILDDGINACTELLGLLTNRLKGRRKITSSLSDIGYVDAVTPGEVVIAKVES